MGLRIHLKHKVEGKVRSMAGRAAQPLVALHLTMVTTPTPQTHLKLSLRCMNLTAVGTWGSLGSRLEPKEDAPLEQATHVHKNRPSQNSAWEMC